MPNQYNQLFLDCTLRDGGFTNDFKWSDKFVNNYLHLTNKLPIEYIELGYWKQKNKSKNKFYNINEEYLIEFKKKSKKKLSVIGDFHYQEKNLSNFPKKNDKILDLIRMTCRIEDLDDCIDFMNDLKDYTNLKTSINFFNFSNYSSINLIKLKKKIPTIKSDYIYFADTHGSMNMLNLNDKFNKFIKFLSKSKKKIGFHFHDNIGTAMTNYNFCKTHDFNLFDITINGIGRGGGNLRTEFVMNKKDKNSILKFISNHTKELEINNLIYYNITGNLGVSNIYATYAFKIGVSFDKFFNFCKKLKGKNKDNFNIDLINKIS